MLTSRCKHFGLTETVPRHSCSMESCEFEDLTACATEADFWAVFEKEHDYLAGTFSAEYDRKLEYAEKVSAMLDKSKRR